MIKALIEFSKTVFIIYGIAILCSYIAFYFLTDWFRVRTYFPLQLFIATFQIVLLRLYTDKFDFKYEVLERLLEYVLIVSVISINWWIFGWGEHLALPFVVLLSAVTYVSAWAVLRNKTRKDIVSINEKIRLRKARRDREKNINEDQ